MIGCLLNKHGLVIDIFVNLTLVCVQGEVPFISVDVLHRIHYLIFILAVVHVVTCTLIGVLGEVKVKNPLNCELLQF